MPNCSYTFFVSALLLNIIAVLVVNANKLCFNFPVSSRRTLCLCVHTVTLEMYALPRTLVSVTEE